MTVCIQYSRPSSGQNEGEVFGLDVAVNNFLSAYFKYSPQDKFICRPTNIPSFEHFKELAKASGVDPEKRCVGLDPRHPKHNLGSISCMFRPDPLIGDLTWRRQQVPAPGFSVCGLVHTMSGERIARAVGELVLTPGDGHDALICPSESIRDAVQNLWEIQTDYYNHHFGSSYKCPIRTPVIPLGINTEKFATLSLPTKRAPQRQALGVADDEIVLLFVGRLSFATKAHPLAMFEAAERAAKQMQKKLRLVLFGYFKPKDMEKHIKGLAADICKTVKVNFVTNDDPRFPEGLWAGADIFISLSDNIQESFGLTPVEAMACGLPAIITDWDGYRGSVRDGLDGFLISTITPPVSAGMAIAEAYYNEVNYGISLMGAAQSTAVDIAQCAKAIQTLAGDPEKRRKFGASARQRAQNVFGWKHIIKTYEDLWADLARQRSLAPPKPALPRNWQAVHPAFPNPWQMFRSFPTSILAPEDVIRAAMSRGEIEAILKHEMNFFLPEFLAPKEALLELLDIIRNAGSPSVGDIVLAFPNEEQDRILRCLGWMLKHGACTVERKT